MTLEQALAKIDELAKQNIILIERITILEDALHESETHKMQIIEDHAAHVDTIHTKYQTHVSGDF